MNVITEKITTIELSENELKAITRLLHEATVRLPVEDITPDAELVHEMTARLVYQVNQRG